MPYDSSPFLLAASKSIAGHQRIEPQLSSSGKISMKMMFLSSFNSSTSIIIDWLLLFLRQTSDHSLKI